MPSFESEKNGIVDYFNKKYKRDIKSFPELCCFIFDRTGTVESVCKITGMCKTTISKILRKCGRKPIRGLRGSKIYENIDIILEELKKGTNKNSIANLLEIDRGYLGKIINEITEDKEKFMEKNKEKFKVIRFKKMKDRVFMGD